MFAKYVARGCFSKYHKINVKSQERDALHQQLPNQLNLDFSIKLMFQF